jgi:hypothetical protein
MGAEGTIKCPLLSKKSKNCLRTSCDFIFLIRKLVNMIIRYCQYENSWIF